MSRPSSIVLSALARIARSTFEGRAFRFPGQLHLLGVRLGSENRRLPRSFRLDDRGATLGLGRLDGRAEQLLFAAYGFELGKLGLFLDHVFRGGRLREWARLIRLGLCLRRHLVRFGSGDLAVAFGLDDDPLRFVLFDRC